MNCPSGKNGCAKRSTGGFFLTSDGKKGKINLLKTKIAGCRWQFLGKSNQEAQAV